MSDRSPLTVTKVYSTLQTSVELAKQDYPHLADIRPMSAIVPGLPGRHPRALGVRQ